MAQKKKALSDSGFYVHLGSRREKEELLNDPAALNALFDQKIKERLQEWLEELIGTIDLLHIQPFIMPGNDDHYIVDDILHSFESLGIKGCIDNVVKIDGIEMISLPYSNPTPWNTPRELSENKILEKIDAQVKKLSNLHKAIFNFHCPPYGTRLDLAPRLDKNMKPMMDSGGVEYIHVGSKAIRKAIEKYQPMLCLHGHVHESPGVEKIGRTVCINTGSEYQMGILKGYVIEVSQEGLQNYWKVEG